MPLILIGAAGVAIGSFLSSDALKSGVFSTPTDGNTLPPAAGGSGTPSIWTIAIYGGVALGLAYGVKKVFSK